MAYSRSGSGALARLTVLPVLALAQTRSFDLPWLGANLGASMITQHPWSNASFLAGNIRPCCLAFSIARTNPLPSQLCRTCHSAQFGFPRELTGITITGLVAAQCERECSVGALTRLTHTLVNLVYRPPVATPPGSTTLQDLAAAIAAAGGSPAPRPVWMLNMLTSDLPTQLAMLRAAQGESPSQSVWPSGTTLTLLPM